MILRIYTVLILILITLPILVMIPLSFSPSHQIDLPLGDFSVRWYEQFLGNKTWTSSLVRSIFIAFLVALTSSVIGIMAAISVDRISFPLKNVFTNLMIAPMIIPVIVVGIAMYRTFSFLKLNDSVLGVVLSHSVIAIPLVFITVLAGLQGVDRDLEYAARSLGSKPLGAFMKVTLPLIMPSVFAGFIFAFSISLDEVIISIFVTGPTTKTLPIVLWENMRTQLDPTIAVAATFLIIGTILVFLAPRIYHFTKKTITNR